MEPVTGKKEGVLCVATKMSKEGAKLVEHLDSPKDKGLVGTVSLLEARLHRHGREV